MEICETRTMRNNSLLLLVLLLGCDDFVVGQRACDDDIPPAPPGDVPAPLAEVDDWVYQLQGPSGDDLELGPILDTAYDLCVIDYSRDGSGAGEFSAAEIGALTA